MTSIISLHDITFTYAIGGAPALRGVTLDVPDDQICAVVGRAGAGKSTLCALCAGFIPNFYQGRLAGAAKVDGQNVLEQPVAELVRHVGLVGSNPFSQISGARFTVYEEIGFGLENLGLPRDEIAERIEWAIAAMQLDELRDRSPYALSGGQQQRMVLAATLAMRPPVLVLDEPTAQLDPPTTAHLAELLRALARQGTTILFAEHRLEWTAELAERVVVLDQGEIIADGPAAEVLAAPILTERGIRLPRPAAFARRARAQGLWPAGRALPVTLEGLVAGLIEERGSTKDQGPRTDGQSTTDDRRPIADNRAGVDTQTRLGVGGGDPSSNKDAASRSLVFRPSSEKKAIIQIENVRFSYPTGVEALRGVSLAIGPGERVALLGRNGAGKSTLLRHMNGLLLPASGQVLVAGVDTRKTTVARCARQVGIVFQDIRNQLFARTVRDELRFGPRNLGYRGAELEALVDRSIEALGLGAVADQHPYDLPSALRRLVAIAAVLALNSQVLILDEPTAGLDNPSIALLSALARDLAGQGKSIVVVSHDLDFCFEALDRVILLQDGQVTLDSSWDRLDRPARAALAHDVGLPLALAAAEALALPPDSSLAAMLAADDRQI
ncbi:MAG: ABC transporter ATP-binding protein [Kouleothrix sp.]|nr:ABC transporter ATP-binding protein [Kouleothrix sp.]